MTRVLLKASALALAAVLFATLAIGNGLDRLSLLHPVDSSLIPGWMKAQAWQREAANMIAAKRPKLAIEPARQAVLAGPVEPASSTLLASALLISGDAGAHKAFEVAGRTGWRQVQTQAYWLLAAVSAGDFKVATERLDAIMRANPEFPQGAAALQLFESSEPGRRALALRLQEGPLWLSNYSSGATRLPPQQFARRMALIEQAARKGRKAPCVDVFSAISSMTNQAGRHREARHLWQLVCGEPGDAGFVSNSSFSKDEQLLISPFDWNLPGSGGVTSAIREGRLTFSNSNPLPAPVARQRLLLPPGPATIVLAGGGANSEQRGLIALLCPGEINLAERGTLSAAGQNRVKVAVNVPQGCFPQSLELVAPPQSEDIAVDSIDAYPGRAVR